PPIVALTNSWLVGNLKRLPAAVMLGGDGGDGVASMGSLQTAHCRTHELLASGQSQTLTPYPKTAI
ncbi:MAG: hypothetical protein AAB263_05270, partial [Planctomycetota bacterium]